MLSVIVFILSTSISITTAAHCSDPSSPAVNAYNRLWNEIAFEMDTTVRPAMFNDTPTVVTYDSSLRNIMRLIELEESIEIQHVVAISWRDETLCWNPADYDGIAAVRVPINRVWMPDITVYQELERNKSISDKRTLARVYSDGKIIVKWPERIKIHCPLSVALFPWDRQICKWTTSSWAYDGDEVQLVFKSATTDSYAENSEWRLISYSAESIVNTFSSGQWYEVVSTLEIERNPDFYVITLIMPSFTITTLCIIGLFSPSSSGLQRQEKCTLGLTALLTMSIILLMVSNMMPKNAANFPLLGIYIIFEMTLTAVGTVIGVAIMYMHTHQVDEVIHPPPKWLTKILCMSSKSTIDQSDEVYQRLSTADSVHITGGHPTSSVRVLNDIVKCMRFITHVVREQKQSEFNQSTWTTAAFRLDCIAFVIFLTTNILTTVILLADP